MSERLSTEIDQIEIHLPPVSNGQVSHDLIWLTEHLMKTQNAETSGGFLGGEFGYGAYFENDVFTMHPFCWCDRDDCPWCLGCTCGDDAHRWYVRGVNEYIEVDFEVWRQAYNPDDPTARRDQSVPEKQCDYCAGRARRSPNFLHKPSGSEVSWYKYIGRGMEVDLEVPWGNIVADCVASLPVTRPAGDAS